MSTIRKHSLLRWLWYVLRHGRPAKIFYFHGGLGDQLLCTAVAREITKRGLRGVWWLSDYPDLLRSNADFPVVIPHDDGLVRWAKYFKVPCQFLTYEDVIVWDEKVVPPTEPLIAALCRQAGLTGSIDLRPYWIGVGGTLTDKASRPRIAIHSSCMNARYPVPNKQWPIDRIQAVVDALAAEADFTQLGDSRDPLLHGVVDLRGCEIAEVANTLASSEVFVGMVGFLMHLARAVDCPAVIIYGGREPAAISGYSCNANLESHPPCSPCWFFERCDYGRQCLAEITVQNVVDAVREIINNPPHRPMRHDSFSIVGSQS